MASLRCFLGVHIFATAIVAIVKICIHVKDLKSSTVNASSLPVYKKYRIASLLCIFETSVYAYICGYSTYS